MTFDIRQRILDADGTPLEKVARQYQDQLLELFDQSSEGQALREAGGLPGEWTNIFIDFGIDYLGVTPAQMSPDSLREILFDIFPRKLSAEPDEASEIIRELQFFWKFLQREFHLENAAACLKVLDDKATRILEEEMSNPANFGIAKSFVMMGKARGFDMSSQEDVDKWMATYNAELAAGTGPRIPSPLERAGMGQPSPFALLGGTSSNPRKVQDKTKRRMAKDSRKKNRKRKG
jgi:hypothetical protein